MAEIKRSADAVWQGELRTGNGKVSTSSGVLKEVAYRFDTRFEEAPGTNPEELIAAAHASCFTMAFSSLLTRKGFSPEELRVNGTLTMTKEEVGWTIMKMRLDVVGRVANLDQAQFQQFAEEAEKGCPVSRLLRPGLQAVEVIATLE